MASNNSICSYDVKNNLRSMIGCRYDSDHDFYEQLKEAIYYDGETYIGVCKRLIELIGSCCQDQHKPDADREAAADWVDDFRDEVAGMLGIACNGMVDDVQDAVIDELDKRLMPEGMEWPRFEDGEKITWNNSPDHTTAICLALDGSCYALHYDMPDDERMCIYEASERVKRPVTEVLGADGLPIKVDETVYHDGGMFEVQAVREGAASDEFGEWYDAGLLTHTRPDTQERIDADAKLDPCEYSCWRKLCAHGEDCHGDYYDEAQTAMIDDLLRRQRELDARTMGGAE